MKYAKNGRQKQQTGNSFASKPTQISTNKYVFSQAWLAHNWAFW